MTEEEFNNKVTNMTNNERIVYRKELEELGDKNYLQRNLWYDYETQQWIE